MFFPDLGTECQVDHGPHVRAVGWLSKDHPYPTGTARPGFVESLRGHVARAWQPVAAAGKHDCELCAKVRAGGNLWIPTPEVLFVAPELIVHYVEAHVYRPPDIFVEAVLACPAQGSVEYFALMRAFPSPWTQWLPA
jgi:hypothetical protein